MKFCYCTVLLLCLLATPLLASGTQIWENITAEDFQPGIFQNTVLYSNGTIGIGPQLQATKSSETSLWCYTKDSEGNLYVGTGVRGNVYLLKGDKLESFAQTKELIVTALVAYGKDIYAATIPNGRIFRLSQGKSKLFCRLPAPYIWALTLVNDTLYAATGPQGELYRVDLKSAKQKLVTKTPEKHLLSMTSDKAGNLYLGTAPKAILYKVSTQGNIIALADFPENEIRSLCLVDDNLYLVANVAKGFDNTKMVKNLASEMMRQKQSGKVVDRRKLLERMMSGVLYHYHERQGASALLHLKKNFFTCVAPAEKGVYCGTGMEGHVYQVQTRKVYSLICDLKDEQIMTLVLSKGQLQFVSTGDTGKLYRLQEPTLDRAIYTSPVHDTGALSFWGHLQWQKQGKLILQTRSGNTEKPDAFWTEWSAQENKDRFTITSPAARYFQYRVIWQEKQAQLESVQIFYRSQNRPPQITSFKMALPLKANRKLYTHERLTEVKIDWKAKDADDDQLRYRLWYRNLDSNHWREFTGPEIYTKTRFKWDTSQVPDGNYIIKLQVTDELENVEPGEDIYLTRPILIDNHPPQITATLEKGKVQGKASDTFGFITQIAYRIGNGDWRLVRCSDGIYDSRQELFEFAVQLNQGAILDIKAVDANGNVGYTFVR